MSNEKHYPLHPGQTQPLPYYTQVPTEEYEANMRELKQLRELTADNRTTIDDVVEINTLTSEVKALREMNVKLQGDKAQLEEDNAKLKQRIESLENSRDYWKLQCENADNDVLKLRKDNDALKDHLGGTTTAYNQICNECEDAERKLNELEEATRWRKCSDELPPTEGSYMCAYKNKNKEDGILLVDEAVWDGEKWRCKFDFWEDIIYWRFKPKAPEGK